MIFVGVDPGARGGYAVINGAGDVKVRPWDDRQFIADMRELTFTAKIDGETIVAAVEKVGAVHGNGIVSTFTFGKNAGFIEGVLAALGIGYQLVPPMTWKKEFSLIHADKGKSIEVCKRLFPGVDLKRTERCRKDSDGCAESILLAVYGKRHF